MAIAHVSTGARTSGNAGTTTTSVARPSPAGVAGNITLCGRAIKPETATGTAEAGWTQQVNATGGTGTTGVDTGATRIVVDYQVLVGGETGTVTFDQGATPNSVASCMISYSKGAGTWDIVSTSANDTVHGTGRQATGAAISLQAGDVIVAFVASDTDDTTAYTSPAITATGMTFGTITQRLGAGGVSQSNDSGIAIVECPITAGTLASVAPSLTLAGGPSNCGPTALVRLREIPPPSITQAAYRFYDDGTETGATALAAQDTAYTADVTGGNVNLQLRIRMQLTTAVATVATDDWLLQYQLNGGGWSDVDLLQIQVKSFASANLTDGAATTNRLGAGTGSFVAGKVSEDGPVDDLGWTASNYTELLYSITVDGSVVSNGDIFTFRVLRNNATTGFTYTQTPTLNITKTTVAVTQAAYRWYDEGTETGAVALAAQNTAATGDVSVQDGIGQLRVLLQSTNAAAVFSLSDWQLQWHKGAVAPSLVDSYPDSNRNSGVLAGFSPVLLGPGQSFLGNGSTLTKTRFMLSKLTDSPTGTVTAYLYAHTGTYGTVTGIGTGSPLATSTTVIESASLTSGYLWYDFDFDGTFTMAAGTPYVIALEKASLQGSSSNVYVGVDSTSPTHSGMQCQHQTSGWNSPGTGDLIFEVWTGGSWTDVVAATSLADSYPDTNFAAGGGGGLSSTTTANAQSFLGDGKRLVRAGFHLQRSLNPDGAVSAALFAHTGAFGTTGTPTGTALTTSTTTVVAASVSLSREWVYFDFDRTFTLTNGTPYCIAVTSTITTAVPDSLTTSGDNTSPTHAGIMASRSSGGTWSINTGKDLVFEVYTGSATNPTTVLPYNSPNLTDGAATTNRLTGGTGTFTAGKISETGKVNDVGWAGNNYTELLYALDIVNTDVVNGDTLRFRVLMDGATTAMTYAQVPTLNIVAAAVEATQGHWGMKIA